MTADKTLAALENWLFPARARNRRIQENIDAIERDLARLKADAAEIVRLAQEIQGKS